MSYIITPDPSTWEKQYEEFWVEIKAWDDNGKPCVMRDLQIQYYMGVNGAAPDPYDMIRLYADADGLLTFQFNTPCRVTAYLVYPHDIDDPSLGSKRELVADDLIVYFRPFITEITLEYTGDPVPLDSDFDPSYVVAKAKYNDGTYGTILWSDMSFPSKKIYNIGDNTFPVQYYDDVLHITWNLEINVEGTFKVTKIWAEYVGPLKIEDEMVKKSEVNVYVEKFDGYNTSICKIEEDEWDWVTLPYPNSQNNGKIKIQWQGNVCTIEVPFEKTGHNYKLDIWYEGPDIVVGHNYDIDNLRARLVYEDGNTRLLNPEDLIIQEFKVDCVGWRWFKATYRPTSTIILSDWYCVYGYNMDDHSEEEFKVIWLGDGKLYEDVTSYYLEELKQEGNNAKSPVLIVWETVREVAVDHKHYGKLKITVPKFSGLSNHVATQWIAHIYRDNREAINAVLVKQFNEVKSYDKDDPKERHVNRKCD